MATDVVVITSDSATEVIRYELAVGLQSPDSGALVLLNHQGKPIAAYAPGTWFMAEEAGSGERQD